MFTGSRKVPLRPGERWACTRCGQCCSESFQSGWLESALREDIGAPVDGRCRAYGPGSHRCTRYETRPLICRAYPFTLQPGVDGRFRLYRHSLCPGFGTGPPVDIATWIRRLVSYHEAVEGIRYDIDWSGFSRRFSVLIEICEGVRKKDQRSFLRRKRTPRRGRKIVKR